MENDCTHKMTVYMFSFLFYYNKNKESHKTKGIHFSELSALLRLFPN